MKNDLNKHIVPTLDSHTVSLGAFENIRIYDGEITDEIAPTQPPACFLGAWYRKVFSSTDYWLGIEGTIRLGEFIPDEARFGSDNRVHWQRYLDVASTYLGGKGVLESDAGLGYNIGYESKDTSEPLNYGSKKVCYRPFYRYMYNSVIDQNGNVTRNNVNSWNVTDPKQFEFYYFPGDLIKMSVYSPIKDYLQLKIEVLETTTIKKYQDQRKKYELKDDKPSTYYSPMFHSEGHGDHKVEFKRVVSIDQYGNEGSNAKLTKAKVNKAIWESVYLYRKVNGEIVKVPFTTERQSKMVCPNQSSFTIEATQIQERSGGESISIHPSEY